MAAVVAESDNEDENRSFDLDEHQTKGGYQPDRTGNPR
jgi:hypothetical protein